LGHPYVRTVGLYVSGTLSSHGVPPCLVADGLDRAASMRRSPYCASGRLRDAMNASLAAPVPGERKRRADWLDAQLAPVRAAHRRALACPVLGGWLLLPQAWAIASIAQAVLVESIAPRALGVPFLVLLLAML